MTKKSNRFLRLPEILARVGVSSVTIWRWEKAGLFPKRHKIGPRMVGWDEAEFDEWFAKKVAGQ